MRTSVFALLVAASVVSAQSSTVTPAPKVTGNPKAASYVATLPEKAGSALRGSIHAVSAEDGTGVVFKVAFAGLPSSGGPFIYHIHEKPVPENGNCTATGAHLDPYKRGEAPPCDAKKPETCQTGDLSGKHGNFSAAVFNAEYVDDFSSTIPGTPAYFGNLSFVLHLANKTRIGCANFVMGNSSAPVPYPAANATASILPTGHGPVASISPSATQPAQFTGAAVKIVGGTGAMLAAAAAFML